MRIPSGTTNRYIYFVAVDSTDFTTRETGLSSFTVYRSRNGGTAAAMTTPTINETDATNMPGVYELLLDEDTTLTAGNDTEEMSLHITHTGMAPVTRVIELYRPETTEGNTLDVTSTGAAGIDWANVENQSTSVDLSATAISLCDTVTTNTDMRGTDSAYTGTPPTAAAIADAVWLETLADHSGTSGSTAEALNAAGAAGDPWTTALPGAYGAGSAGNIIGNLNDLSSADVNAACDTAISDAALATAAALATVDANVDAILVDTGTTLPATLTTIEGKIDTIDGIVDAIVIDTAEIGAAGAGLTAVPWNAAWDAEVQSEVTDALNAYDPPTRAELTTDIGTVTTAISALNDPTAAAIATAVLTTQMTESYAADGVAPTLAQAVFLIQQGLLERAVSGTTETIKRLDKSTTAATYTLDDATTPTSKTRST